MPDASPPRKSLLRRFFSSLWRGVSWLRVTVLNLLFLFVFIVVIASLMPSSAGRLPERAPLLLAPSGVLVDQYRYASPQQQLLGGGDRGGETLVREMVELIDNASGDARISGIILKLDHLQGGGLSKMQEIGAALERFQTTEKPVIAIADNLSQQQYFLASYADEIYLHDLGGVELTGFALYRNYFKQALDKLSVKFHVFKVGQFKDFVEPYIREDMSTASRKHNEQWLSELWSVYTQQVEAKRELDAGSLTAFINEMENHLASTEGDTAQLALNMGLVDHIGSRNARNQALVERFGQSEDDADSPLVVTEELYRQHVLRPAFKQANIALIVATGTILDGHQTEGNIGGDTLTEIIRRARHDEHIQAIVLRIDSGGGSAFASEIIRDELQAARDDGKAVIVSMGSVAASGGYWIAMAADQVWATPTTITGSIGVFGVFPTFEQTLSNLGIQSDGVGTTDLAGAIRLDRPLSNEAANILQQGVEHIYDRFVNLVAQSRQSTPEAVHEVAQGRVWTGAKALELGLVDQLGGLNDAIGAAAELIGVEQYQVRLFEREISPQEQLMRELLGQAQVSSALEHAASDLIGLDLSVLQSINRILGQQSQLTMMDAPRASYALCMTCMAP